jgi:cytoskeletal protein RodZ
MARGSFGELLKREREMREVSLNEVTVATRIAPKFLEALENQDWEKLPGGFFNRGFVRAIARYLGLDEEHLLAEYDLARGEEKAESTAPENRIPSPSKWLVALAVLVILLGVAGAVAAGVYGWRRYTAHRTSRQSFDSSTSSSQPQSPSTLPSLIVDPTAPASNALLTSSDPSALDLSVSTSAATHVRILGDGKLLLDTNLSAGENRRFSAGQRFEVTAADTSAVLLELNGQTLPPPRAPGASGTIVLSQQDLRQAQGGNSQP